jgi:protease YdgD
MSVFLLRRLALPALALLVGLGAAAPVLAQANTCRWANDRECDEARYGGTGACESGTDANDCRAEAAAWQRLMDAVPASVRARMGNDSCRWAHDAECDDINFGGTGACQPGTDASDCRALAIGGDESCRYSRDNECDEPGIGTGVCISGTDTADCAPLAFLRNRTNTCESAFNGLCEEPGEGNSACRAYTDTADCVGRQRPVQARDHYFGEDERILVDVNQMPWSAVGLLTVGDGSCTATLIGPRVLATAAHCMITENGAPPKDVTFQAGFFGGTDLGSARVVGSVVAPGYSDQSAAPGEGNGDDWAILTLDRDLGTQIGFVRPYVLDKDDLARIRREEFRVSQAGYSWDTGSHLSGHMDCRVLTAYRDGSLIHTCDTTRGDSGSPLLTQIDGEWRLIAVDSQFFDPQPPFPQMSSSHLAVDTRAFAEALRNAGTLD